MKLFCFVLIISTQVLMSHSFAKDKLPFPNKSQREEIASKLLSGIESIDAVTIELRNKTRIIDWNEFKAIIRNKIMNSFDWSSFYRSIDNLHYGILSRHSYVVVGENIQKEVKHYPRWPKLQIGYTWPEVSFFSTSNHKSIELVNGRKIEGLFEEFFNLYCNDVHRSGCLRLFSTHMSSGYQFSEELDQIVVNYVDGSLEKFENERGTKKKIKNSVDCLNMYSSLNLNLIYAGSQSCLYEINGKYVLKIFYFGEWGASYDDIYCEDVKEQGMCFDINEISRITRGSPERSLVIDIQNNEGGTENTPWIAALTKNGFKDNLVAYKNISLLSDPEVRGSVFYFSDRAEKWYQKIIVKINRNDIFFPIRPDFCRGSVECNNLTIDSSLNSIRYKELKLVVNGGCVSSCDDFIWRLREYADAKTYGQLPATDGAYARLNGYLFMNAQGQIVNIIAGDGNQPSGGSGTLLVTYQIPISKTVAIDGELLEGNDSVLDNLLPINKNNFNNLSLHNLKETLRF
ncbi:hypothetical protein [Vibrio nigripulchritudo]|uniref:hypothetical protein n=1 Tax=Vibrio nigripulchritudo TaxID=28173 RepID=UPI0005FA55D4|nr:hypothetical protein [Vibrio nigripulchritudo]KJY75964.1 hypothetical protein TW74_16545 [Vibrio nigripulchritudo]